jgi:aspartyl-tRNA(Asn)/glutamyl-tRNA(Gln) amidotransferase subunit C
MAQLKIQKIAHIAKLANLTLTSSEVKLFKKQLENVIEYVDQLNVVDTKDAVATSQTTGLEQVTRVDKCGPSMPKEKSLSEAHETYNDYFKVPIILENKEI